MTRASPAETCPAELDAHQGEGREFLREATQVKNIQVPSADGQTFTLLLEDCSCAISAFEAGRLAVCDRLPGTSLYVAIAYHEMFFDDTVLWSDQESGKPPL